MLRAVTDSYHTLVSWHISSGCVRETHRYGDGNDDGDATDMGRLRLVGSLKL